TAAKPNLWQYIGYSYGRRLPNSMRSWVARDLAGDGAIRRHMLRWAIPPLLVLAPLWLLPASIYVHTEMTAPLYFWALLISLALNKVWRRHRLADHGLDPNLVDVINRRKQARMHEDYSRRYGPRPESAEWQSNSSPF
ncbi:MAG: hypothetical protein QOE30_3575, partial [Mycobacterium sp.]|uniref:DUF5313 domain-containing protein n=1 Tax=Mycobacterium sp. TaxID=1785 RepID=UPI0028B7F970